MTKIIPDEKILIHHCICFRHLHRSLVDKIPAVIAKGKTGNIRGGAGTSRKILGTIGEGVPFKVI